MNFVGSIPRGRPGISGFQGKSGFSGFSGISGFSGYSGFAPPSEPAVVQQKTATAADGSAGVTATFDTPLTADNSVIACISYVNTGGPSLSPVSLVGGLGGTLNLEVLSSGAGVDVAILALTGTGAVGGGETALTFSLDLARRASVVVFEVSGLASGSAESILDNTGLASDTVTIGPVTPVSTKNLVVAMGGWTANNYQSGPTDGFTRLTPTGGGAAFQEAAYLAQSGATAKSTGWTITAANWAACIAVFGGV